MSYTEEEELYNVANVNSTKNVVFLMIKSTMAERVLSTQQETKRRGKV